MLRHSSPENTHLGLEPWLPGFSSRVLLNLRRGARMGKWNGVQQSQHVPIFRDSKTTPSKPPIKQGPLPSLCPEKADSKRSKNGSKSCSSFLGIVQFLNSTSILFPPLTFLGPQQDWKPPCHQPFQLVLPCHVPRTVVNMW